MKSLFTFTSAEEKLKIEPIETRKDPSYLFYVLTEKNSEGHDIVKTYKSKAVEILKSKDLGSIVSDVYENAIKQVKRLIELQCKNEKTPAEEEEEEKLNLKNCKNLFFFYLKNSFEEKYINAEDYYLLDTLVILVYKIIVRLFIEEYNDKKSLEDEDLKKLGIDINYIMPDLYFNYEHLPNSLKNISYNENIKKLPKKYSEEIYKIIQQKEKSLLKMEKELLLIAKCQFKSQILSACTLKMKKVFDKFIIEKKNNLITLTEEFENIIKNFQKDNPIDFNNRLKNFLDEEEFPLNHNFYFNENEKIATIPEKDQCRKDNKIINETIKAEIKKQDKDLMQEILDSFKKINDCIQSLQSIDEINKAIKDFNDKMAFIFSKGIEIPSTKKKFTIFEALIMDLGFEQMMLSLLKQDVQRPWFTIFGKDFQNAINFLKEISEFKGSLGFFDCDILNFVENIEKEQEFILYEEYIDDKQKIQIKQPSQNNSFLLQIINFDSILNKEKKVFLDNLVEDRKKILELKEKISKLPKIDYLNNSDLITELKAIDTKKIEENLTSNITNLKDIKYLDIVTERQKIQTNVETMKNLNNKIEENVKKKESKEKEISQHNSTRNNNATKISAIKNEIESLKESIKNEKNTNKEITNKEITKKNKEIAKKDNLIISINKENENLEKKIQELTSEIKKCQSTIEEKAEKKKDLAIENKEIENKISNILFGCKKEIETLCQDIFAIEKIQENSIKDETAESLKIKEQKFANVINTFQDVRKKRDNYQTIYDQYIEKIKLLIKNKKISEDLWSLLKEKIFVKNKKEIKFNDEFLKNFQVIEVNKKEYNVNFPLEKEDLKKIFMKFITDFNSNNDTWKKIGNLTYFDQIIKIMNLCKNKDILKIDNLNAENLEKFGQEKNKDKDDNLGYFNFLYYFDDFLQENSNKKILFIEPNKKAILKKDKEKNILTEAFWNYYGLQECIKNFTEDEIVDLIKKNNQNFHFSYYSFLRTESLDYTSNIDERIEKVKKDLCKNYSKKETIQYVLESYIKYEERQRKFLINDTSKWKNIQNIQNIVINPNSSKLDTILKKEKSENIDHDFFKNDQSSKKIITFCGIIITFLLLTNLIKSYYTSEEKKLTVPEEKKITKIPGVFLEEHCVKAKLCV